MGTKAAVLVGRGVGLDVDGTVVLRVPVIFLSLLVRFTTATFLCSSDGKNMGTHATGYSKDAPAVSSCLTLHNIAMHGFSIVLQFWRSMMKKLAASAAFILFATGASAGGYDDPVVYHPVMPPEVIEKDAKASSAPSAEIVLAIMTLLVFGAALGN